MSVWQTVWCPVSVCLAVRHIRHRQSSLFRQFRILMLSAIKFSPNHLTSGSWKSKIHGGCEVPAFPRFHYLMASFHIVLPGSVACFSVTPYFLVLCCIAGSKICYSWMRLCTYSLDVNMPDEVVSLWVSFSLLLLPLWHLQPLALEYVSDFGFIMPAPIQLVAWRHRVLRLSAHLCMHVCTPGWRHFHLESSSLWRVESVLALCKHLYSAASSELNYIGLYHTVDSLLAGGS